MPLNPKARTFEYSFKAEDGTDESMTFRHPTTTERLDVLGQLSKMAGSLEEADKDAEELGKSIGWDRVREMMELYLELGEKFLVDAKVSYEANGQPPKNITEIGEDWQRILLDDVFYGEHIQKALMEFFRTQLAVQVE